MSLAIAWTLLGFHASNNFIPLFDPPIDSPSPGCLSFDPEDMHVVRNCGQFHLDHLTFNIRIILGVSH
jgi:hypothetical protein